MMAPAADDGWPEHGRVLLVCAHPDDPEFNFGATVAKLVSAGADVSYVICSNGVQGGREPATPDQVVQATRYSEQRAAAAVLGVRKVVFLSFRDGQLAPTPQLRKAIARELRRCRPGLVLTHYPRRALNIPIEASHPDHVAVGEATLAAVYPDAGNPRAFPELLQEGLEPHMVDEVWLAGYEQADHVVDATPFLDRKIEAILCHQSQLDEVGTGRAPEWVYTWMHAVGKPAGYQYAELFKRIRVA
jgi:LmbE family N-acetylglucosaminyl deacetylase